MINQERMIFGDFSVNFNPISIVYYYPYSGKKIAKLYLIFQKLDHLPCYTFLELALWGYRGTS